MTFSCWYPEELVRSMGFPLEFPLESQGMGTRLNAPTDSNRFTSQDALDAISGIGFVLSERNV